MDKWNGLHFPTINTITAHLLAYVRAFVDSAVQITDCLLRSRTCVSSGVLQTVFGASAACAVAMQRTQDNGRNGCDEEQSRGSKHTKQLTRQAQRQQPLIFHLTSLDHTHTLTTTPDPLFWFGYTFFAPVMSILALVVMSLFVVLLAVSDVVYAGGSGTAALYSSTICSGSAVGTETNLPTDGTCFTISGFTHFQSGTMQCNSAGQVTGTLYTDGGCGIVAATGSGTGNGATCITLYEGSTAEAGSKINCGSGGGGGSGSAPSWVGTYHAGSQCNQATCCCLTGDITVSESGSDALVSGGVTGQCGSATRTTITVPYPTSNSFTTTLPGGDQATFTLSGDGTTITEMDSSSLQCGGTATRVSNGASISFAVDAKVILIIAFASLLALLHA